MSDLTEDYTHGGIQRVIRKILDSEALSQYELAKRAELNPSTIYQILSKDEKDTTRPPRLSTVTAIAHETGHDVKFNSALRKVHLTKVVGMNSRNDDVDALVSDIRTVLLRTGKQKFSKEEKDRIIEVLRALVTTG